MTNPRIRVRFVYDEDARFEECNGEPRPLTELEYAENEYQKDGKPVSYDMYLAYYGNPDRHVYLGIQVESQCPCCNAYTGKQASLWNIDFMDDDRELRAIHPDKWLTVDEALALPGYAGECVKDLISEVAE